ncbi:MAG: hypothetical protein IE891_10360 [Flavobacteriaceae bacterium]|nr:hypothetical protein [Flavobacteriaceae bacterium]
MKTTIPSKVISLLFLLLFFSGFSQVGIGTTAPKAALDVNSTTHGFLMPRVALVNTITPTITNPNGGALEIGTMVFNTATTSGIYGVIPGLYFWDGSQWVSNTHQYYRTNFKQNVDLSVASSTTHTNIPGLNSKTFTAPYSGEYQIIFSGYLGTETVDDNTTNLGIWDDISGYSATAYVEGKFRLTVNGTNYDKYSYSVSYYRSGSGSSGSGGTDIYQLFNEITIIATVNLAAGSVCTLNASYLGDNDDNVDAALPHVVGSLGALGNPCEINVTYLGR